MITLFPRSAAARGRALAAALLLILPSVTLATDPSPGTTGRVEGTVRDQAGAPIANAQVVVVGTALSATSDSAGRYVLPAVRAGRIDLQASFVGFKSMRVVGVRVRDGRTTVQHFTLERSVVELQEATVVTPEGRPVLVPRDEVAAKQRAEADVARRMAVTSQAAPAAAAPPAGGWSPHGDFNTEEYKRIYDNRFLPARGNPLSTFGIDVDRASYTNVRRFLMQEGRLPPADAVRIEELVNYFPYAYPEPRGEHPFAVATDIAPAPWAPEHRLVRIGLQGRRIETAKLPASNLVFLIDVSGSMDMPTKLPLVKQAFRLLVDQLRPQDRVAIVVYAGAAGLVLPSTPGDRKGEILAAIERLQAGGSTAGGAGIQLAYDEVRRNFVKGGNNRVVLATDGDFNVGVSSEGELVRMVEQRREEGAYLTVLGFGSGNLKDARMEQLADKGNGNYGYVDNLLEARKTLVSELGATLVTIAKDVKLQVEFNPARVQAYRLIGYENRLLAKEDFDDDTKDSGEMGAGHSVTALYEVVPVGAPSPVALKDDSLRYQQVEVRREAGATDEWLTVKLRYKDPKGGASRLLVHPLRVPDREMGAPRGDFAWATAVAGFGMVLRESEFKGSATFDQVLALARAARGEDAEGYRAEFVRLVELARDLKR